VLKIQFAQIRADIFLERKIVIRNSVHKARTFNGMPAANLMQPGIGWYLCACTSLEGVDQRQTQSEMNRFELNI
jgi:hypothetical protein